ncbi:Serine carboxypeptidase-like [Trema orientale]|uniref:Carboxypeptidase n=1 Tax=Trema orientale TaxID=63057 RepID=A0A2P5FRQ2_TREOI|nr:Serine carboxypeptidase-like [Trema orientale]
MLSFKPWMAIILCIIEMFMAVNSYPLADKIEMLPGQPEVNFQQFSGYITVDERQERALFYYFVEAENDPLSKPLVLWLNGGPGCSSVGAGGFTEHGPFIPFDGVNLIKNEYSWNKEANMLYLESPAGVGFSYSTNKSFYIGVGDIATARDSLVFLRRWFEKFPEYKNREFYISGESYAGHYVPQLAKLITHHSELNINLKGISIGNPLLDYDTDLNAVTEFRWSHGLISDFSHDLVNTVCNHSQYFKETVIENGRSLSDGCALVDSQLSEELTQYVDVYDVLAKYCFSSINEQSPKKIPYLPLRLNYFEGSSSSNSELLGALNRKDDSREYEECIDKKATKYLNRKDVQKALHARLVGITEWSTCSKVLKYDDRNRETPTIGVVGSLVKAGIRAVVYSGDQDTAVPFIGTRKLVDELATKLKLSTTVPYKAWFENKKVGGWTQVYGYILSFATIRGASHTAPSTQPARSYLLFKSFLSGKPLPTKP